MRFRYPFQKVVDLKVNEKQQAQWLLGQSLEKLRHEEHDLRKLQALENELARALQEMAAASVSVQEIKQLQQYLQHVQTLIAKKLEEVRAAEQRVHKNREGLNARAKEEKIWTMAKEKAHRLFRKEMQRKEQFELDEIAAVRMFNI